jgi:hypothetical protein
MKSENVFETSPFSFQKKFKKQDLQLYYFIFILNSENYTRNKNNNNKKDLDA